MTYNLEAAESDARITNREFMRHMRTCRYCREWRGQWCRTGQALEGKADAATNRVYAWQGV